MIYLFHLMCKNGCDVNYTIETDSKDYISKTKPKCIICGNRLYAEEDKTTILGPDKVKTKTISIKKIIEKEAEERKEYKLANDKRRKK